MQSETNTARRTPRIRTVLCASAAVFAVVFLVIWFLIPPTTNTQPVSLQRDQAGHWQQSSQHDAGTALTLSAHAGSLKSNNSLTTGTVTTHSSPGFFGARSLVILNQSDHLLMRRVGDGLLQFLREKSQFDRIDYFPYGHLPEVGQKSPDLFVVLKLAELTESGLLGTDLRAKIRFTLGTSLVTSNHSVSNSYSPPTLSLFSNSVVDHKSTMIGVTSSAARFSLQGLDIAKEIGETVVETVENSCRKYDVSPDFSESLYPSWNDSPELKFLDDRDAIPLTSMRGLCCHNETFWLLPAVSDAKSLLEQVHSELSGEDWKGDMSDSAQGKSVNLRMTKGPEMMEVFHVPSQESVGSSVTIRMRNQIDQEDPGIPIYVRYRHAMAAEERQVALDEMLTASKPNMKQLIALIRLGTHEQRQRLQAMIQESPPRLPGAWILLAQEYSSQKKTTELEEALRNAYMLSRCQHDDSKVNDVIRNLCRKHKLNEKSIRKIDFDSLLAIGLPHVTVKSPDWLEDLRANETVVVVVGNEKDWQVVSVKLDGVQRTADRSFFDTTTSQCGPRSRSSSSGMKVYTSEQKIHVRLRESMAVLGVKQTDPETLRVHVSFVVPKGEILTEPEKEN